jgi:hypothetical protein
MGSISLKTKSKSNNLTAPGDVDLGAMIPIATSTVSSATATVTFSSIPQNYEHLQIRFLAQSNRASANSGDFFLVKFNSDSGANYNYGHQLLGNGSTASSYANGNNGTSFYIERITNYESMANAFTAGITDILDYTNTNKYKTVRSLLGYDTNSAYGQVNFASGLWMSTNAISNISISLAYGPITQYSTFALYGIKKAGA